MSRLANLARRLIDWASRPFSRNNEVCLHPYTTRKLAEREYRHFDHGWQVWRG